MASVERSTLSDAQKTKFGLQGSAGGAGSTNKPGVQAGVGTDTSKGDRKPDHGGRKSIYVFGDSLTVGMDEYLGDGYTVDAVEGRASDKLTLLSDKFKAKQFNRNSTVVVWLGTNDGNTSAFQSNMHDFLKIATKNSDARIILGKVWYSVSKSPKTINRIIDRLASEFSQVDVLDFTPAAKNNLAQDKIHLTAAGYKAAAKLLTQMVNNPPTSGSTNAASTGGTSEPQQVPGSFAEAKKYIDPQRLKEGVFFNPPLPNKAQWKMENYPNLRGFIVRDPSFQKTFAGKAPQEGDATAAETDPNLTKRQKKKLQETVSEAAKWQMFDTNYGFRFLYNPDSFSEAYSGEMTSDPIQTMIDVAKGAIPMVGTGITVQFKLLLSRFEDMQLLKQTNWADFYPPGAMNDEQRDLILKYGTMADIEYLFRMVNGNPQDTWHGNTADWGMLIPTPTIVSFGDTVGSRRLRGYINSIGYDHKMLIAGMIPVYTELNIVFNRLIDSYYDTAGTEAPADQSLLDKVLDKAKDVAVDAYQTVTGGKPVAGDPQAIVISARTMLGKYDAAKGRVIDSDPNPEAGDKLDDGSFVWYAFDVLRPGMLGQDYMGRGALARRGREVQWGEIKDGDIVYFAKKKGDHPEHVAIYSGNGQVIHFTNEKNVKQPVEESFNKAAKRGDWMDRPVLIRRVIEKP